jgi:uncharacterized protein YgiM (DUF1202 family)
MFRSSKFLTAFLIPALILLTLGGCSDSRVILGQAYVAPATLRLHTDLSAKSTVAVELKHGDHLQILDVQRHMVRVLTDKNVQGWTDPSQLLSPEQMDALKQRRQKESLLPPEGTATAYEALNVHIDPERQSPAFTQIPEGGMVTVLGHKMVPKLANSARTTSLVVARPQPLSRKSKKEQKSVIGSFRLPPRPAPPKPPENWLALSAERIDGGNEQETPKTAAPEPKVPAKASSKAEAKPVMDDWTLVRTKNNQIGWVLTRNILMSIPDEVAQYAEGKSITAFFDLGLVNDDVKGPKHNWLWATSTRGEPHDFDSWRVFLWNNRRHRYETSYRQRDLEGYFPIRVAAADAGSPLRTFSMVTKDDDGKMRQRSYTFDGHLVHLANTEDYNPAGESAKEAAALDTKDLAAKAKSPGWFRRQFSNIKHRIFGN